MGNLIRWQNPFSMLEHEVARFFDDGFLMPMLWPAWMDAPFAGDNLAVDMYETDEALHIEAAMPGIAAEDIQIEENDGILTIRAQQKEENAWRRGNWQVRERHMGAWQRAVRLPVEVKVRKADAVLKDGVLHITLPKVHPKKRKINRIPVRLPKLTLPRPGNRKKIKITT